jgi:hypothetical protein
MDEKIASFSPQDLIDSLYDVYDPLVAVLDQHDCYDADPTMIFHHMYLCPFSRTINDQENILDKKFPGTRKEVSSECGFAYRYVRGSTFSITCPGASPRSAYCLLIKNVWKEYILMKEESNEEFIPLNEWLHEAISMAKKESTRKWYDRTEKFHIQLIFFLQKFTMGSSQIDYVPECVATAMEGVYKTYKVTAMITQFQQTSPFVYRSSGPVFTLEESRIDTEKLRPHPERREFPLARSFVLARHGKHAVRLARETLAKQIFVYIAKAMMSWKYLSKEKQIKIFSYIPSHLPEICSKKGSGLDWTNDLFRKS